MQLSIWRRAAATSRSAALAPVSALRSSETGIGRRRLPQVWSSDIGMAQAFLQARNIIRKAGLTPEVMKRAGSPLIPPWALAFVYGFVASLSKYGEVGSPV